jgi:hypothetical protein
MRLQVFQRFGVCVFFLLTLVGCGSASSDDSLSVEESSLAIIGEVQGEVLSRQSGEGEFKQAEAGFALFEDGQVKTMEDGYAHIDFEDESKVRVGPNTLFTIMTVEGEEDNLRKGLFLSFGELWIGLNGGKMEIDTDLGTASVQGSYLKAEYNQITDKLSFSCFEGLCSYKKNKTELVIFIGETLMVNGADGSISKEFTSQENLLEWTNLFPQTFGILDQIPGSISNFVWKDINGNGLQDDEEPAISGVNVHLLSNFGEEINSTVTDDEGFYVFDSVMTGEYALKFEEPEGLLFTLMDQGADDHLDSDVDEVGHTEPFSLAPGEHIDNLDAGMVERYSDVICPLTGLPIENSHLTFVKGEDPLALRPLLLSISKVPDTVRPLATISFAPVVFETVQHDGDSRLQVLIYCGLPAVPEDQVGDGEEDILAFRSARTFYTEIADLFSAGLLHAGATSELHDKLRPYTCSIVVNNNAGDIGGAGIDITRLIELSKTCELKNGNPDMAVWKFGPPAPGGEPVESFLMHYHHVNQTRWIYEPEAGGYVRYQNGPSAPDEFTLSTDRLNGEPVVRQNVLILITEHTALNRRASLIEFKLTHHGGFGYLFRDGMRYKICWSAINRDYPVYDGRFRPFLIFDCNTKTTKEPINIAYGTMWVNIVDVTTGFGKEGDDWRAYTVLPKYQAP